MAAEEADDKVITAEEVATAVEATRRQGTRQEWDRRRQSQGRAPSMRRAPVIGKLAAGQGGFCGIVGGGCDHPVWHRDEHEFGA